MNQTIIDLRQTAQTVVKMDFGTSAVVTWSGIASMDTGYTLTLDEGLPTEQVYTVGSGLTLGASSIAWNIGAEIAKRKTYTGVLVSDTKVVGAYLRIGIKLEVA